MKLKDARDAYKDFSAKASDIARYLGFAGLAIIWIFTTEIPVQQGRVPSTLVPAAIAIVVGLVLDFLQYAVASAVWAYFARKKEMSGVNEEDEFQAPAAINYPTNAFYWLKFAAMAVGYGYILVFLVERVL